MPYKKGLHQLSPLFPVSRYSFPKGSNLRSPSHLLALRLRLLVPSLSINITRYVDQKHLCKAAFSMRSVRTVAADQTVNINSRTNRLVRHRSATASDHPPSVRTTAAINRQQDETSGK
ncbi:hypothetical protein EVAR_46817_1 [Eumeta japonica]|uniref:Uncharacterized protein n=1 Tax=Eumeta variegata TaxID=151549 RepID=A0A4C1ZRG5_EUMVA|nr:hypothetical protein EVAR_46817_1 [Eumeta japonica]